ncbi:MAG: DUF547 domain-containing protein, partial [Lentisphaerae bacterium]
YVSKGLVTYRGLKTQKAKLAKLLESWGAVAEAKMRSWPEKRQLAFLINLYNAATLKLIVDHYPVKSIKDIGGWFTGPWDQKVVPLWGRLVTLNFLEHKLLRKEFHEPRIHLALVCAARGCPPLRSEAYRASRLDAQLDDQAQRYFSMPTGLQIDNNRRKVLVSKIFKWYSEDFESVRAFIRRYVKPELQHAVTTYDLDYLAYDWRLNEQN